MGQAASSRRPAPALELASLRKDYVEWMFICFRLPRRRALVIGRRIRFTASVRIDNAPKLADFFLNVDLSLATSRWRHCQSLRHRDSFVLIKGTFEWLLNHVPLKLGLAVNQTRCGSKKLRPFH